MTFKWNRHREYVLAALLLCAAALSIARLLGFDSPLAYSAQFIFDLLAFIGTGVWFLSDWEQAGIGRKALIVIWATVGIAALIAYLRFP